MAKIKYPEHKKVNTVQMQSQAIGEFVEWLRSEGYIIARHHKHDDGCRCEDDYHGDRAPLDYEDFCKSCGGAPRDRLRLCGLKDGELVSTGKRINAWLALHFGIDENRLEAEKRQMLREMRGED